MESSHGQKEACYPRPTHNCVGRVLTIACDKTITRFIDCTQENDRWHKKRFSLTRFEDLFLDRRHSFASTCDVSALNETALKENTERKCYRFQTNSRFSLQFDVRKRFEMRLRQTCTMRTNATYASIQRSNAFWSIDFVTTVFYVHVTSLTRVRQTLRLFVTLCSCRLPYREQVDLQCVDVDRYLADSLRRIGVHYDASRSADGGNLFDRLYDADFVVHHHHRNEAGFVGDFLLQLLQIEQAVLLNYATRKRRTPDTHHI
jgi:hypothetical protein